MLSSFIVSPEQVNSDSEVRDRGLAAEPVFKLPEGPQPQCHQFQGASSSLAKIGVEQSFTVEVELLFLCVKQDMHFGQQLRSPFCQTPNRYKSFLCNNQEIFFVQQPRSPFRDVSGSGGHFPILFG
jgi:hypothetical protein